MLSCIEAVASAGQTLTPELGGKAGTREVTDAVLEKVALA